MRPVVFLLLVAGTLAAAPVPKDFKTTAPTLAGTWRLTGIDYQGQRLKRTGVTWVFAGDTLKTTDNADLSIRTDPTASPKEIQFGINGFDLGVYEIDGDELVISTSTVPNVRPTTTEPGPNVSRYLLKRVKDK